MSKVIGFEAGNLTYYALKQNGDLLSWNPYDFPEEAVYMPMPVDMGKVKQVLCMPSTVFSIDSSNSVRGWGQAVDGLLDIPVGLKAKRLFSSSRKTIGAILLDNSVAIWGSVTTFEDGSNLSTLIPAGLQAKFLALYDEYALAINMAGAIVSWGKLPEGFVIPAGLEPISTVCSTGTTAIVLKDTGYLASWKTPAFHGVPVFSPEYNFSKVKAIDCFGNCYAVLDNLNKLVTWTFNPAGGIIKLYSHVSNVASFKIVRELGVGGKPRICVIHKSGLVSMLSSKAVDRKIPASLAHFSSQSSADILATGPAAPTAPIVVAPVAVEGDERHEDDAPNANAILNTLNVVNPQPEIKPVIVKSVSLGLNHGACLTEDGKIVCWGDYKPEEVVAEIGVKDMICGSNSIHYINSDNNVVVLSASDGKRVIDEKVSLIYTSVDDDSILVKISDHGINSYNEDQLKPVGVPFQYGYSKVQKLPLYTVALTKNNKVKLYARSVDVDNVPSPNHEDISGKKITDFAGGNKVCLIVDSEGLIYGWKSTGFRGESMLPDGLKKAKFVTGYLNRFAAIKPDNSVVVWSYDDDDNIIVDETLPKRLKAKYISLSAFGIAIVNILGKVYVVSNRPVLKDIPLDIAGSGGDDAMRYLPALPENSPILQLACGKGFTLCLRKDTTVAGWGSGELLEIPAISAKYVCAGDNIAGAITMDDNFVGWGPGADGGRAFEPIDRKKMKKVILHKSGLGLTLAGEVIVFGLPEAVRERYTVPAGLDNVGNIEFLEYGEKRRYMALKSDMTVVVWGDDMVPVPGNAVRIAVGRKAFLVVRKNGLVEGYGTNANKELEIPAQLRAKDIYAGDSCLAISATNSSFGSWGPSMEDTEAYQGSTNWLNRGFAFGNMNKKVAYLAYSGYHYGAVNLDGQVILWGNNDTNECSVPSLLKNSMKPFNMNGAIRNVALNWDYGCAIVDGSIKVWGGLNDSLENRLANLSAYSGNDVKQVLSAGKMWFGLIRGGNVIYWNTANGATSGVETNLLSINNHSDYDKLACSKTIIVGLIKGSGKVRAYGKRGYGIQKIPASIKDGGVKDIFAGPTCAMAINANDELVVWGEKRNTCLNIPADLGKVKSVVFGDTFAVAIKLDGDLYMWGGLTTVALQAARLLLPKGKFKVVSSSEGQNKYVGIREDGSVVEWGGEHFIQEYVMPFGLKATQVYTSGVSGFSVAVDLNGELVIWGGSKGGGQNDPLDNVVSASDLTIGEPAIKKYVAKKNVSVRTESMSEDTVTFISAGAKQVGIIDAGGNVITWGPNANNEQFIPRHMTGCDFLCIGPTCCVARNSLGQYFVWGKWAAGSGLNELPEDLNCKKMVLTDYTGLAINEDDKLVKWGRMPGIREDADETNLPEGLVKARDIAGFYSNFIAADMEGQIYLWGKGDPIKYDNTKKAIAVAVGLRHYMAILEDNSVISWGSSNEYGQSNVPVGLKAKKIASFYHFTVAIDMDDNLVGWGYPSACSTVPTGLKAVDIACGGLYAIAHLADGKYVIWGHNINNNVALAPTEAFLDPSLTLADVARYDFRKDFDVATKYQLNRKQFREVARQDKVFDMVLHKAGRNVVDFLMEHQGNAVIFRYKGEQTATLKSAIEAGFREKGDSYRVNVFYECKGKHVMEDAQLGTFDFQDIYKKPYYQLNLANGTFLITMDDLERVFKSNQFWILQDTGIKLDYTASYWSVVAGGPLISANHCQEGSDKMVYMLVPFSFISEEEDEEEEAVAQDKVKVKLGEEVTEVDITESKRVLDVKTKFGLAKGVAVERLKFIAGGKILKDDDLVVPGIVVQVILASAGGNLRVERVNKTRKL